MKKILLGVLIVFLLIAAFFDTKDYVLGNKLKGINKAMVTEVNPDYETAKYEMEMAMDNTVKSIKASYYKKYKLPNNNYYILKMINSDYKMSYYLLTGLIEIKNANETLLTFPKDELQLISVNDKYEQKSWDLKSKAGVHHFKVGEFSNSDNLDDRFMLNGKGTAGVQMSFTPKKGVIEIDENGIWLDHGKNKVGMNHRMQSFTSEKEAIAKVKQDDFGKQVGVVKANDMHFYIFKNEVDVFDEYTVIPVLVKDNQLKAGKFERFTFNGDFGADAKTTEAVEGFTYRLHFQQDADKFKHYEHQVKVDKMHIAVKVRGESHAK